LLLIGLPLALLALTGDQGPPPPLPPLPVDGTLNQLASIQIVGNVPFDNQVMAAKALGFRRVRLAARWGDIERPRGRFTWRPFDDRIAALTRAGITPIIVIFGGNGGYPGLMSEGEVLTGYARFAGAVAKRYGTGTPERAILYEIWNEPNTKTFWRVPPDPESYATMAGAACAAIRQERPDARVLALGMEGTPVKRPYFVPAYGIDIYQQWAARAATPALMACADGFSMHPYLPTPEQVLRDDPALRAFMAAHWRKQTPPIVAHTEIGYAIDPRKQVSGEDQAALDLRALLIGTGLGRVTNLYQSVDTGRDPAKPDGAYGLVTYDGRVKPAGAAVQRLLRLIGDHRIGGVEALPGDLYRFSAARGADRAVVLWSTAPRRAKVTAGAAVIDLVSGAPVSVAPDATVPVGPNPVLATWSQ
jgi:hypothetical protein